MKKFFKVLSIFGLLAASVIFAFVIYGIKSIPDSIHLVSDEKLKFNEIYSYRISSGDVSVSVNSENAAKGTLLSEYTVDISALKVIPVKSADVIVSERKYVIPSGDVFGIRMFTKGVVVVGSDDVYTEEGISNPSKTAGLNAGDIILTVNGNNVNSTMEIEKAVQENGGNELKLSVKRGKKVLNLKLTPALSKNDNCYKAGIWVRDSMAGVGTITFIDSASKVFGGLGHAVCDVDTGIVMPLADGDAVKTKITGCYKGSCGSTGELCGVFQDTNIGTLSLNTACGVYGFLNNIVSTNEAVPIATKQEVKTGSAKIISTVDEKGPQYYDVRIVRICNNDSSSSKNMIIEITDSSLIEKTGGIIQGMSGSPIIQDGMLIGAVTHVFVNDPIRGYAVFADNMLKVSEALNAESLLEKAS